MANFHGIIFLNNTMHENNLKIRNLRLWSHFSNYLSVSAVF